MLLFNKHFKLLLSFFFFLLHGLIHHLLNVFLSDCTGSNVVDWKNIFWIAGVYNDLLLDRGDFLRLLCISGLLDWCLGSNIRNGCIQFLFIFFSARLLKVN